MFLQNVKYNYLEKFDASFQQDTPPPPFLASSGFCLYTKDSLMVKLVAIC